jgi:hypothetical protein
MWCLLGFSLIAKLFSLLTVLLSGARLSSRPSLQRVHSVASAAGPGPPKPAAQRDMWVWRTPVDKKDSSQNFISGGVGGIYGISAHLNYRKCDPFVSLPITTRISIMNLELCPHFTKQAVPILFSREPVHNHGNKSSFPIQHQWANRLHGTSCANPRQAPQSPPFPPSLAQTFHNLIPQLKIPLATSPHSTYMPPSLLWSHAARE